MVFYKCTAVRADKINREQLEQETETLTHDLANATWRLFDHSDNESMVFTASVTPSHITFGVLAPTPEEAESQMKTYLHLLPFPIASHQMDEITYNTLSTMLAQADRLNFIPDRDDVLEKFEMDQLFFRGRITFGEGMIDTTLRDEDCRNVAKEFLFLNTLNPELARIEQGTKNVKALGHPVHYLLHTDDRIARKTVYKALLSSLYRHGRLRNQRYAFVDYDSSSVFIAPSVEALYRCSEGGAVVIRYGNREESDSEFGSRDEDIIAALCEIAARYKNRVLTILCLPQSATRIKEAFFSHWNDTAFVELQADLLDREHAQMYLKNKAKAHHLRADKALTALTAQEDTCYTPLQLNRLFDRWHSHKLRHQIYPQYQVTSPVAVAVQQSAPVGSAYQRLQELIGLTEAKDVMQKALTYFKAQKLFADRGMRTQQPSMHMVFTGNPGTAKTTVARLFAEIMRENGLLSTGDIVEVGRADIVGKYVGQTAPLVKAAFARAKGGVLFIDEAYSLVDDRSGLYGDEAINTIVQEMENNRADTIVIFAGYPDKMEGFLSRNPGLRSRIAFHIPFADYSADELCAIARHIAADQGLTLTDAATNKLRDTFTEAGKTPDFGNGRFARNLIEKAKMAQANRLMAMDLTTITDDQLQTLCAEDIEAPPANNKTATVTMGFCA